MYNFDLLSKTLFQAMSLRDKLITIGFTAIAVLAFYNMTQQFNSTLNEQAFSVGVGGFFTLSLMGWLFYADRKYKRLKRNRGR